VNSFRYQKAGNISEALKWSKESQAYYLAGGTDLLGKIKTERIKPSVLIDLKKIPGLRGISFYDDRAEIGPLTTIREIEISPQVKERLPILSSASGKLGSVQVRNKATIGGNICNAAPSAETVPALLCLDTVAEIVGPTGVRQIPLDYFFIGPGQTILQNGEILRKLIVKVPPTTSRGIYHKLSVRRAMDIAFVGVAVLLEVVAGKIAHARIGLGAVAPVPMRVPQAENLLAGNFLSKELITDAAYITAQSCQPISDIRASADYRRLMVKSLIEKALWQISTTIELPGGEVK